VYRSRASRNIWLANELGIPFRHVPVIQHYRLKGEPPAGTLHTKSPEFLAVNPNGHIPSIDDDGLVLHESLAINLYLARKHGGPLAPKDIREEGLAAMWTLWAATEAEPHTIQILYHMAARPPEERDPAIAAAALEAMKAPMAVLDRHLAKDGFMMGGRFTVVDVNVAEVMRYSLPAKTLWETAPHASAWLKACHARPAYQAMMAGRNAEPE
ncbi:MAG TPA: glutathione S-transferase family protein, partial [Rhabdaerophilum sp.]|nr:glutathione S-transferase family protein [Rhabdaerophilum sp.]